MTVAVEEARRRRDEVVDALAAQAAAQPVGTRLPGEALIMSRFGVTRSVARSAIEQLEGCHLVRRVQGMGTYVHRRLDLPVPEVPSFHRVVAVAGARPRTVVIDTSADAMPRAGARAFAAVEPQVGACGAGAACKIERLGFIDDEPAAALEHWVTPNALPEPAVAARVYESLHDCFEAAGAAVRCVLRRATTEDAPTWVCRRLEIPARSVAWLSETACVAADTGRPLYYARTWWRTDQVRLVFTSAD